MLAHPIDSLNGMKALVTDRAAREAFGDQVVNELSDKIDRMKLALEQGGDDQALQLGRDLGELVWQVGSIATGAGGIAKGGVKLATVGIKLSTSSLESMAGMGRFEKLLAKGGQFNPNGTPIMDFRALSNAQKSIVGDLMGGERIQQIVPGAQKLVGRLTSARQASMTCTRSTSLMWTI